MCFFILIQRTIVDAGLWNVIYVEGIVGDGYSARYSPMVCGGVIAVNVSVQWFEDCVESRG